MTQRDGTGRGVGGGFRMGNTCIPWLIHVNVWQKALQYCKVISLQLKLVNKLKKKKMWQEYTGDLYKQHLHDPDNHDGSITHLEPDILECKIKWALRSITINKASGGDVIPVELF